MIYLIIFILFILVVILDVQWNFEKALKMHKHPFESDPETARLMELLRTHEHPRDTTINRVQFGNLIDDVIDLSRRVATLEKPAIDKNIGELCHKLSQSSRKPSQSKRKR